MAIDCCYINKLFRVVRYQYLSFRRMGNDRLKPFMSRKLSSLMLGFRNALKEKDRGKDLHYTLGHSSLLRNFLPQITVLKFDDNFRRLMGVFH